MNVCTKFVNTHPKSSVKWSQINLKQHFLDNITRKKVSNVLKRWFLGIKCVHFNMVGVHNYSSWLRLAVTLKQKQTVCEVTPKHMVNINRCEHNKMQWYQRAQTAWTIWVVLWKISSKVAGHLYWRHTILAFVRVWSQSNGNSFMSGGERLAA